MKFRTEINPQPSPHRIDYDSNVLFMGSCFAEAIGGKLAERKFNIRVNPFGIIFNPISLLKTLKQTVNGQCFSENLYVEREGIWRHYDFHSCISASSKDALKEKAEQILEQTANWMQNTDTLILTFGTAFVYRHKATGEIVANCHKVPAKEFEKELLSVDQIVKDAKETLKLFPQLKQVIITVSPVRHLKDTLELNSVSKSTLRLAVHKLCEELEHCHYFPAYELLLDDLRDYRFFEEDMLHPTITSKGYIWEKFSTTCISQKVVPLMGEIEKIMLALSHRPFNPDSEAHKTFQRKTLEKLKVLNEKVDFSTEINNLKRLLY